MRILLDECVPRPFRRELTEHDVRTVPEEMGWAGKRKGILLSLMSSSGFDVLITTDQNLRHQQDLASFRVSVVIMMAPSNRLADLTPLALSVRTTLGTIQPGDTIEIHV
jgi:hypothetical protein